MMKPQNQHLTTTVNFIQYWRGTGEYLSDTICISVTETPKIVPYQVSLSLLLSSAGLQMVERHHIQGGSKH